MKKKNYDDETPGVVGSVLLNMGGHMLIRADFFIDKQKKKNPLKGTILALHDGEGSVNCFAGDTVKITKNGLINITELSVTCDFASMLSNDEIALLDNKGREFIFNGFIEQMNIFDDDAAIRFRVTSRINAQGTKLRVDKLVSYCQMSSKNEDKGLRNSFVCNIFSTPLRKAVSLRYSRKLDVKSKHFIENVFVIGTNPVQNVRNFLKKNC